MQMKKVRTSISLIFNFFRIPKPATFKFSAYLGLLLILSSSRGFSFLEDRVGNGGELSEKQMILTYANFSKTLAQCLSDELCLLDKNARSLTEKIQSSFSRESENSFDQLQFLSARLHPEIFGSSVSAPLWLTTPEIGAIIFVNTDKLTRDELNRRRAISTSEAFRIIFVALAIHQKEDDLLWLDSIGLEILQANEKKTISAGSSPVPFVAMLSAKALGGSSYLREDSLSAETWLAFYYTKIKEYLKICLAESPCAGSPQQKDMILMILDNMNRELSASETLKFESGQKNPTLFTVDGVIKTAVTGLAPGATIFFNLDYLYQVEGNREFPLTGEVLLALLIHELGHHAGYVDHALLDVLGQSVAKHFEKFHPVIRFQEDAEMGYFHKPALFRVHLINAPKQSRSSQDPTRIYLADELYFYDFNPELDPFLKCSKGLHRLDYRINSANWTGKTSESDSFKKVPYDDGHGQKWYQFKPLLFNFLVEGSLLCTNESGVNSIEFLNQEVKIQYSREYRPSELGTNFMPPFHYVFDQLRF